MRSIWRSAVLFTGLLCFITAIPLTAQTQENQAAPAVPLGFENAQEAFPDVLKLETRITENLYIIPKKIIHNGRVYGILDDNNQIYRTRTLSGFSRLIPLPYDNDADAIVHSFDMDEDAFLLVTTNKLHIVSPEKQLSKPNSWKLISAVLMGDTIHAINRNETFNDMENVIKVIRDSQIVDSRAWQIGIKPHHRNTAATYQVRKTAPGSYTVFSRLTGEIIPSPDSPINVGILDDSRALARAQHNMAILNQYLKEMSAPAEYINVISEVLVHDGHVYAIFITADSIYWKEVYGETAADAGWTFKFIGDEIVGLMQVEGRLELYVTYQNPYVVLRYSIGLQP